MKSKKVITGTMVARWSGILGLVLLAIAWVISGVREGALIPEFVREEWWLLIIVFIPCISFFIPSENVN